MVEDERYVFSARADILDRSNSQNTGRHADSTEDYAIVSRVLNSKTGKPIVIAAGITGLERVPPSNSSPIRTPSRRSQSPSQWLERKNIEVVLHASVTNGVPIAPDVVATYLW